MRAQVSQSYSHVPTRALASVVVAMVTMVVVVTVVMVLRHVMLSSAGKVRLRKWLRGIRLRIQLRRTHRVRVRKVAAAGPMVPVMPPMWCLRMFMEVGV